jgi:Regulators of stationary/sporulation gene expression
MKSTGIVRKIDELGRIVLPIEFRRTMDLDIKDPVEIFTDDGVIILRKYQPACDYATQLSRIRNNIAGDGGLQKTLKNAAVEALDAALRELEGSE